MSVYGGTPLELEEVDNRSYAEKLESSLQWAYRAPEGLFLLQHILSMTSLFSASDVKDQELFMAGKRALGMELVQAMLGCRNGNLIAKTVFNAWFDQAHKENGNAAAELVDHDLLRG
jgi:hypothetical protein